MTLDTLSMVSARDELTSATFPYFGRSGSPFLESSAILLEIFAIVHGFGLGRRHPSVNPFISGLQTSKTPSPGSHGSIGASLLPNASSLPEASKPLYWAGPNH